MLPADLPARPAEGFTRLLSWNMGHRVAAWPYLVELARAARVEVALLQEAARPRGGTLDEVTTWPDKHDTDAWRTRVYADERRYWCAAIVWFPWTSPLEVAPEPRTRLGDADWLTPAISHPGQFAVARITPPGGGSVAVVSLYGIWDGQPGKSWIFTEATTHRALSDLTPLMQSGEQVVIAGDLNILHGYPDLDEWMPRANTIFDRVKPYGFEVVGPFRPDGTHLPHCPCGGGYTCRHVATRPSPSGEPWQLDYVISNLPEDRFDMWALPIDPTVSDHAPIIIDVRTAQTP